MKHRFWYGIEWWHVCDTPMRKSKNLNCPYTENGNFSYEEGLEVMLDDTDIFLLELKGEDIAW